MQRIIIQPDLNGMDFGMKLNHILMVHQLDLIFVHQVYLQVHLKIMLLTQMEDLDLEYQKWPLDNSLVSLHEMGEIFNLGMIIHHRFPHLIILQHFQMMNVVFQVNIWDLLHLRTLRQLIRKKLDFRIIKQTLQLMVFQ